MTSPTHHNLSKTNRYYGNSIDTTFSKRGTFFIHTIKIRVLAIIERVIEAETLADVPNLKIMEGAHNYFRIRLGDYRIGIFKRPDNVIEFQKVGTRGDFYNRFP